MLLPSGLSPHVWMAAAEHHLEDPTARLHAETPRLVPWSSPGSTRRCLQGLSSPFNSVEGFVQVALILLANFGELRATSASTAGMGDVASCMDDMGEASCPAAPTQIINPSPQVTNERPQV